MFKILSIDGGGIKGVFPAAFITAVEEQIGEPIGRYFDLIAGTSTGGIIALSLGLGLSARSVLDMYMSRGHEIFPSAMTWSRRLKHYFRRKFDADPLKTALTETFGENVLGQSRNRLVIPSFNALDGSIHVYKTPHDPRFETDWRKSMVDVAMATSAAPSYFPPYINRHFTAFLDGGLWANNPTGNAVVEAIGILKEKPENVHVLSLGCTCSPKNVLLRDSGMWGWRKKALEASFSGQSFGSMGIAALLIGHSNIERIDPSTIPGRFEMDDPSSAAELAGLGHSWARDRMPVLRQKFLSSTTQVFNPLYGPLAANPV